MSELMSEMDRAAASYWRNVARLGGGDALGAGWRAAMEQHHVGVLGVELVERGPDTIVIVAIGSASEGDAWSLG